MQKPVAIAYLLARAADAIADTANLSTAQKLRHLLEFKSDLNKAETAQFDSLDTLINSIKHRGERQLLAQLPAVFSIYFHLPASDFNAVHKVVNTLTSGMVKDLEYFNKNHIRALPNDKVLDDYTYYVAGCVGEFWTALSINHCPSLSQWKADSKKIQALGIQFGKALQLTNILRDISKDAKMGRCYLPASDLEKHNLDTSMLTDKKNNIHFKPVIDKWLNKADAHFDAAQSYLLLIPRSAIRLRLASLWPILIGLSTLKLIRNKQNYLDENLIVKVERKWVYAMLALSIPAALSNTALKYWIKKIRHAPSR